MSDATANELRNRQHMPRGQYGTGRSGVLGMHNRMMRTKQDTVPGYCKPNVIKSKRKK